MPEYWKIEMKINWNIRGKKKQIKGTNYKGIKMKTFNEYLYKNKKIVLKKKYGWIVR